MNICVVLLILLDCFIGRTVRAVYVAVTSISWQISVKKINVFICGDLYYF